jgi:probable phosphoglycerate mutase
MATPPTTARKGRSAPAATLVLFVRHGTTPTTGQVLPGRAPGLHLADAGRAQAEAVALRLEEWTGSGRSNGTDGAHGADSAGQADGAGGSARSRGSRRRAKRPEPPHIAAVYSSPLERTRETAAPIGHRLGLKVATERGLLECDFGEWTGAELKQLAKLPEWTTVQRYPSGFTFPGGESFSAMRARIADTVARLCRRHPGETVVAVSHADPIKAAVSDALGTHLDLFQRIVVSPCSITAISYHATGPVVLAVNSTGSLSELRPS